MSERHRRSRKSWKSIQPRAQKVRAPSGVETFLLGIILGTIGGFVGGWSLKHVVISARLDRQAAEAPSPRTPTPDKPDWQDVKDLTRSNIEDLNRAHFQPRQKMETFTFPPGPDPLSGPTNPSPLPESEFLRLSPLDP